MKRLMDIALLALCGQAQATISLIGVGTLVQSSTNQTVAVNCPAGVANDVRIYFSSFDGAGTAPIPSGATSLYAPVASLVYSGKLVATSSDAQLTVTTGTSTQMQFQCALYRGIDVSGGIAAIVDLSASATNSSQTLLNIAALSTPSANNELIIEFGKSNNTWTGITTASGFTAGGGGAMSVTAMTWSYQVQTTAASIAAASLTITGNPVASTQSSMILALKAAGAGGGGTISITSVNSTNIVTSNATGIIVAGANFGASQVAGGVTLRQTSCTQAQTVTAWGASSITITLVRGACLFGSGIIRVTENGGTFAEKAIALNPPTGTFYQNLSGGLTPLLLNQYGAPTRLY